MISAQSFIGKYLFSIFVCAFFVISLITPKFVLASDSCTATISPSSVNTSINTRFDFSITNGGTDPINNIKLYVPSPSFTLRNASVTGWSVSANSSYAELSGGSIATGSTLDFSYYAMSGDYEDSSQNWQVFVNSGGGDTACTGSMGTAISGITDVTAPIISDAVVSGIYSNKATVAWTTDEDSTSTLDYGEESGNQTLQKTSPTLATSHSLTLESLTANTTYYFYLTSTDASNNTSMTNEVSFTTAAADTVVASTVAISTTTTTTTITTIIAPSIQRDVVAPSVSLSTNFNDPYREAPTIEGKAIDGGSVNVGVISVEFSLDGGKNWLPVDNINTVGKKSVTYDFTPVGLEDGNYQVKVRAKDSTGNTGQSKIYTLVIDRLPPQVGGTLFSLGPMILKPNSEGLIYSIAGLPIKAVLSAVGGPINMDLFYDSQKFSLIKNTESGLWNGFLDFSQTGTFRLLAKSIDGANNETERYLSTVVSLPAGKVLDENQKPLPNAKIKVFTFEKTLNDFTLWDAAPYSQTNPQIADEAGEYRLILPAGKYFLEVESLGKRKLRSDIFELNVANPINQNFQLDKAFLFLGNWWSKSIVVSTSYSASQTQTNSLIGKPIPDFDLTSGSSVFSSTSILGKSTVLSFISTWEPQTSDQLIALDTLHNEYPGINVIAVATQESPSKVEVFQKIGGYSLPIQADRDGVLVIPLSLESLPTHYFLDRKGIIKDVVVGFIDKDSLLNKVLD